MKYLNIASAVLIAVIMVFGGCGAVKKIKERERIDKVSVLDERVEVVDSSFLKARWLLDGWSAESAVVIAVVESDSLIAFDPQNGFELQGGRVLYGESREASSSLRASGDLAVERNVDSVAERDAKEEVHLRSAATDKTREGRSIWLWSLLLFMGAIGISLIVLRRFKWSLK